MKMKIYRVFLLVSLISILFLGGFNELTYAKSDDRPNAPTSGIPADKSGYGSLDTSIGINSTNYLKSWASSILESSNSTVKLSGTTTAYTSVDKISISLYLQVYNESNGTWEDYAYVGGDSDLNQDEISDSVYATVSGGYYYRTKAKHSVTSGSTTENSTSYSKYIYIDSLVLH